MKNIQLMALISELKTVSIKEKVAIWKRIASDLEKPSRQRRTVNLYKIELYTKEGEAVIVPGKVLGLGNITKKVTVAAYEFSAEAKARITNAGGKAISIKELMTSNPKGSKIRILG